MRPTMFTEGFARAAAALGRIGSPSLAPALHRVTMAAARGVPGCAAATAVVWQGERIAESAVSHPDLGALVEFQNARRKGPAPEARRTGDPILVEDTMREDRWPDFAKTAVRYGVRSLIILPLPLEGAVVTFGLYAVRSGTFDRSSVGPVAALLDEQVEVALRNVHDHEDAVGDAGRMPRRR